MSEAATFFVALHGAYLFAPGESSPEDKETDRDDCVAEALFILRQNQIDAINVSTVIGLRDRALIGLMVYSFARIGAAIGMRVEDVSSQNRRLWVRLHEKGGKQHAMPFHHNLEAYQQSARPDRHQVLETTKEIPFCNCNDWQ